MDILGIGNKFLEILSNITDFKDKLNISPEMVIAGAIVLIILAVIVIFWGNWKGVEIAAIAIIAIIAIVAPFMDLLSPWWTVLILVALFLFAIRDYFWNGLRIGAITILCLILLCLSLVMIFSEPLHEGLAGALDYYESYQQGEAAVDYLKTTAEGLQEHPTETAKQVLSDTKDFLGEAWDRYTNKED